MSQDNPGLQQSPDGMKEYFQLNKLEVNVNKKMVMIFSNGKICKKSVSIEWLKITFNNNNNKFEKTQKELFDKAPRALFCIVNYVTFVISIYILKEQLQIWFNI